MIFKHCTLVVILEKDDKTSYLSGIKAAIGAYFEESIALLPISDELILQKLNSPDPMKL